MKEVYITRVHQITEKDKLTIKEAKERLKKCPICGAKAYISKDIVDGFYFGWSVGCPRFCLNDGIHGIDENTPTGKHLSIMNLDSAKECVERWNKKVDNYFKESDNDVKS